MTQQLPDFSAQATKKALIKETVLHPLTLYSGGMSVLSFLAIGLFGLNWINGTVALGSLTLSGVSWIFNYFARYDVYTRRHLESLRLMMEAQKKSLTDKLSKSLKEIIPPPGTEELVQQAKAQFPMLNSKFDGFRALLADKFAPTEITYGRYLGSGEQLYLSVLDQLNHVVSLFKSIDSSDMAYAKRRIDSLKKNPEILSPDDRDELVALEKRVSIVNQCLKDIDVILSRNEEALTALELAKASIASIQTSKGQASAQLPDTIKDLEDLAQRAKQYAINNQ